MKPAGIALILLFSAAALLGPGRDKAAGMQTQTVSEARLREVFTGYLCKHLRKAAGDVVVSRFKISGNGEIPEGPLSLQVFQKERGTLFGHVRLAAILSVGGVARREVSMSGWVDVFEPAVCTARPIKKGEILEREDLYLIRKNISRIRGPVITDADQAAGLMAKHHIRENACLKEWMVEKAPVLNKGDVVTILAQLGGLRVTVRGTALERGYPGEMVKVQNMMSQKTVLARVIDGSNVLVEF